MHAAAKVLVVDDDADARDALAETLHRRGYRSAAAGAADAPRVAGAFRPDVVVLEMVGTAGLVGDRLARRLRAAGDPLLVFLSREHDMPVRLRAFEAGADDYLTKPYDVEELLARMRAVLRRSGRHGYAVSQVGRLVVDERAHHVEFEGRAIELGPTDFLLLAALARHAGLVLTKQRLLELVWGYEPYDENLVVVRVSLLRRSLGPAAARLIHTVRRIGYVLRDDDAPAL